jgi:predicted PurR-regulated permease PerM
MLKRIIAVVVMVFSVLGAIFCVAGILGAWVAQTPVKNAVNGTLDTANGYVALANQATQNASERIAGVRTEIQDTQQRLQNLTPVERDAMRQQMRSAAQQRFGPSVAAVRNTTQQVSAGLTTLNQTLESFNRIPGVNVPTLTDELSAINERVEAVNGRLQNYQAALSETEFNGERLNTAATQVTDEIQSVESRLGAWQGRFGNLSTALENAKGIIASVLTMGAVGITLFFGLFLAGQLSLFSHALGWFRQPRKA